jgi:cytochrome c oxidase accessory protein FixG
MTQTQKKSAGPRLLSPWRHRCQWLTSLLILVLPWIQPGGNSLLRIDVASLSLYLFGQVLRIEELYFFLLFCLVLVIGLLLITLLTGRVWCGWACPQTTLNDLAEWFASRLKLKVSSDRLHGALWRRVAAQLFYLLLAMLVSANLLWYFIEPQRFFGNLLSGRISFASGLTFSIITLIIYLDLALIRRLMCKEFCPYGRLQTALIDPGTLTLQLPEAEKPRCINCNSCVRNCPMEIDIRNGYQIECINCGRCLDACRTVMHKRRQPGLIHYTFGVDNQGAKALLNSRTLLLCLALATLLAFLVFSVFTRAEASLKVSVSHSAGSRILNDGQQVTFFNAWINNRGTEAEIYHLLVRSKTNLMLTLKGQTQKLTLAGGENRKLDYVLVSPAVQHSYVVEFELLNSQNQHLATAEAQILPIIQ